MNRKPIFDAIRTLLGRPIVQSEVRYLDLAFEEAAQGMAEQAGEGWLPKALEIIKQFEGYGKELPDGSCRSYPDPATGAAPWTIGFGTTGPDVVPNITWSRQKAELRLAQDIKRFARHVDRLGGKMSIGQKAALVSFTYNVGPGRLEESTLLRHHRAGRHAMAAKEFGKWVFAAGKRMRGLERRRKAERALYRS